jgi:hypothetical protein
MATCPQCGARIGWRKILTMARPTDIECTACHATLEFESWRNRAVTRAVTAVSLLVGGAVAESVLKKGLKGILLSWVVAFVAAIALDLLLMRALMRLRPKRRTT